MNIKGTLFILLLLFFGTFGYTQATPFKVVIVPMEIEELGGLQAFAWGQHDGRVRRRRVAVLGYPRANPYLIEGYAACSSSCACCSCGPLLIGTSLHRSPSSSVPGAGSLPSSSPRDLSAIETSSQTPICHRNRSSCGRGTTS